MRFIAPVLLALILNCTGIYIFSTPKTPDNLPYMTYVLFLVSITFLLCSINLKPTTYHQTLFYWVDFVIEFVLSMLLMEFSANFILFPIETVIITTLSRIPEFMEDILETFGLKCKGLCGHLEILKLKETLFFVSYVISIFFFLCITHATHVLDFTILINGGVVNFIEHTGKQGQKLYEKIIAVTKYNPSLEENYGFTSTDNCAYAGSSSENCNFKAYLNDYDTTIN